MCGIAGLIDERRTRDELLVSAHAMASTLRHRGPDDVALWADSVHPVAFGFTRLAIQDLSPRARQPMVSSDQRFVMAFNGEVYNFVTLRGRLEAEGVSFRSTSDSEVMLEAIAAWGLETALDRSNGMFALAVYDRVNGLCSLVRDRLGEKPLYYGSSGSTKLFASELKAVRSLPGFRGEMDLEAIRGYFAHGYVPGPGTVHQDVRMVPPGCAVEMGRDRFTRPRRYWRLERIATREAADRGDTNVAIERTRAALQGSVERRLVADVPVGVFLSGGVDSTLITALASRVAPGTIDAFTVGFADRSVDEATGARRVADAIGVRHHVIDLDPSAVLDVVPSLPEVFDEPFADPAAVATLAMAREVKRSVTVVLSGDGADELFGGYPEYRYFDIAIRARHRLPRSTSAILRRPVEGVRQRIGDSVLPKMAAWSRVLASWVQPDLSGALFQNLDVWSGGSRALRNGAVPDCQGLSSAAWGETELLMTERAMLHDQLTRLPDRMLTKVDRASMRCSVEVRTPFLDPDVVAASWSLPVGLKLGGRASSKAVLRRLLTEELDARVALGGKHGFSLPLASWLRTGLRGWAEELLGTELRLHDELLDVQFIKKVWRLHVDGRVDNRRLLWTVLMYLGWARAQRSKPQMPLAPATIVTIS